MELTQLQLWQATLASFANVTDLLWFAGAIGGLVGTIYLWLLTE